MSHVKSGVVVLLLSLSAGCGRQVVEFKLDGGTDSRMDARLDAGDLLADAGAAAETGADVLSPDGGLDTRVDLAPDSILAVDSGADLGADIRPDAADAAADVRPDLPPDVAAIDSTVDIAIDIAVDTAIDIAVDTAIDSAIDVSPDASSDLALAPTVLSTKPAPLAMNVSINQKPTATFSRAMDMATLNMLTFTVTQGLLLVPVAGAVSYDAATNTATFTPTMPLNVDLPYTATITTGAKDVAGRPLAMNYAWSFRTAACSQAPVTLGVAGNFAVLAGATVTSTGPTSVTGNLGVSPGTAVTGFPPGIVVGTQHAGDPTAAIAIANLTTAYNEAKGRTLCPVGVAGNLGGMTLYPGLYKSTTSLEISSGDLTLDARGEGDAVFIFQMASTLTTTSGRQIILTNGARAANVYWQVGTSATLGTTTAFVGTVMADQAITMNSGATLNGRVLARIAAVALDSNTIVRP